jgi:hypothetical protein
MTSVRIGGLQVGIILLTLATAAIHFYLGLVQVFIGMLGGVMFLANAAGYSALLGALYLRLPIAFLSQNRSLLRWALVAFAAVTILGWLAIGDTSLPSGWLGYVDKAIEVALIVLLVIEARQK